MEEASCKRAAYVSSYQTDTDAFSVIQGAAARVRPKRLPEDFFTCKSQLQHTKSMHVYAETVPLDCIVAYLRIGRTLIFFLCFVLRQSTMKS